MVLSHLVFVGHFLAMVLRFGPRAPAPRCSRPRKPSWRWPMENEVKLTAGGHPGHRGVRAGRDALHAGARRQAARGPQALHQRRAARAQRLHRQRLRLLPQPAAARPQLSPRRRRARLGPGLGAGRLLLRQPAPAGQHAHRARPVQHRRAPAQHGLAPGPPLPAARLRAGLDHAVVPLPVRGQGQGRPGRGGGRAAARLPAAARWWWPGPRRWTW
jgi:hypothetical protein